MEGWKVVFSDVFLPKVELAKSILAENHVDAIILNQQDSNYLNFGEVKLLVQKENMLIASQLLKSLQSE